MYKSKYKCNLVVPGFAKSGTSSLHDYLNLHPKICMSSSKEPHFFAIKNRYENGCEFHNKIFSDCRDKPTCYGESSTTYSLWEPALARIKKELNSPKIILVIREPVDRLLSHYNWLWALGLEKRSLMEAVCIEERIGFHPDKSLQGNYACYLRASNYSYWCPLISKIFGAENVLYIDSSELFNSKESALKKCFDFLGVSNPDVITTIHSNKTSECGIQRTFGLKHVAKHTPKFLKKKFDPDHRIRKLIYNILGKKKVKNKPEIKSSELEDVKDILSQDRSFYKNIFSVK